MKNKLSKIIRIVTIAPIMAAVMLAIIQLAEPEQIGGASNLITALIFLTILPVISYPLQPVIPYFKHRSREGQRNLAIIFANIGYISGIIYALAANTPRELLIIYLTYFLSGLLIVLFNKVLKIRASGHACSTTAPAFLLTWKLHPLFAIPSVLLIAAVYRSSLKLSRHSLPQLLAGSAVSLLACVISIMVYGVR